MGTRRAAPYKKGKKKRGTVSDRNSIWPLRVFRESDYAVLNHASGYPQEIDFTDSPILEFYLAARRKHRRTKTNKHKTRSV